MIPKIIHQIWIQGYDNIPDKFKEYHKKCKIINKNFEHIFWDETKIINLIKTNFNKKFLDLYHNYIVPAQKADFARYMILYIFGGIYLDMDMICIKNLTPFLKYECFFTVDKYFIFYKRYLTGIIGSIKNYSLFEIIFKNLFLRIKYKNNITYSTGTSLVYDSVKEYTNTNKNNIVIIDRKYLHPCGIFVNESCKYTCEKCFVVHTNNLSWNYKIKVLIFFYQNILIIILIFLLIILIIMYIKKN